MVQGLTTEQEYRILAYAKRYARNHWEVKELAAHISVTDANGTPDMDEKDGSYLVCLGMPGVGDIQRIVVVLNDNGTVERDHTYGDDAGCFACQGGHIREYMPDEESEE
jgi:hypothetical protein